MLVIHFGNVFGHFKLNKKLLNQDFRLSVISAERKSGKEKQRIGKGMYTLEGWIVENVMKSTGVQK